jgi:chromosome segregation ATPase
MTVADSTKIDELEKLIRVANEKIARLEQTIAERGNLNDTAKDTEHRVTVLELNSATSIKHIEDMLGAICTGTTQHCQEESDRIKACEVAITDLKQNHEESTKHWENEHATLAECLKEKASKAALNAALDRVWQVGIPAFVAIMALLAYVHWGH